MINLEFRELKKEELVEALNLAAQVFADLNDPQNNTRAYAEEEFALMFCNQYYRPIIYVGKISDQIICMSVVYKDQMTSGNYSLSWVAVDPEHRKKGYGKAIMDFSESKVLEMLAGKPGTFSFTTSKKNFGFYEKLGFKKGASIHEPKAWFHKVYNQETQVKA